MHARARPASLPQEAEFAVECRTRYVGSVAVIGILGLIGHSWDPPLREAEVRVTTSP